MKQAFQKLTAMATFVVAFLSCSKNQDFNDGISEPTINKVVFSAAGDSAAIVAKLNEFRLFAGDPLNTAPDDKERAENYYETNAPLSHNYELLEKLCDGAFIFDKNRLNNTSLTIAVSRGFALYITII